MSSINFINSSNLIIFAEDSQVRDIEGGWKIMRKPVLVEALGTCGRRTVVPLEEKATPYQTNSPLTMFETITHQVFYPHFFDTGF